MTQTSLEKINKAIYDLISTYYQDELDKAGVSARFVANYFEANIDYLIDDAINGASEIGEVHCIKCDEYFTIHDIAEIKTEDQDCVSGICKECAL